MARGEVLHLVTMPLALFIYLAVTTHSNPVKNTMSTALLRDETCISARITTDITYYHEVRQI